ncbi:MAG: PaaI family thioesterase [Pseudomonadota bacterium]
MTNEPRSLSALRDHAQMIMTAVPWATELGFQVTAVEDGKAVAVAPWRETLVGDPETGVIAGGVITALLDNICGVAVAAALKEFKSMATLDLRIDYMRPASRGEDVIAEAECFHVTRSVAFCHAWAYHEDRSRLVATASAAFALNTPRRWTGRSIAAAADPAKEDPAQ